MFTSNKSRRPFIATLRVFLGIFTLAAAVFLGSLNPSMAQLYNQAAEGAAQHIPYFKVDVSLNRALKRGRIGRKKFDDPEAMKQFYAARHNEPYWMSDSGVYTRAVEFTEALEKSWTHGLNPYTYHTKRIQELINAGSFLKKAELELLLTDAFVRYARDLSGMRVDDEGMKVDGESWQQRISAYEALSWLTPSSSMERVLGKVEPQGRTYKRLQRELVRLTTLDEESYVKVLPIEMDYLLRPGERHERVPDIRVRLGAGAPQTNDKFLYDDKLAAAVIKFQRAHKLNDDGIIGSNTLQLMNRTNRKRIEQVIVNLERLRWVERQRPSRYVVVNVPAATLWAIDRNRVEFEMPVIVGKPWRRTRSFKTNIHGVRFNPDWTIPPSIKRYDVLPKILEDSNYLHEKGIQLISGHGHEAQSIDPAAIDWETISPRELSLLRMIQIPGDENPLGRIRVLMTNRFNIYLHDTNHPEYFEKPTRALSSGCIRMKYPEKMAHFIMKYEEGWSTREMEQILETEEKTDLEIENEIPVYVMYYTVWTDSQGRVVYGTDIYKQDDILFTKLSDIDGFYVPGHNNPHKTNSGRSQRYAVNQ